LTSAAIFLWIVKINQDRRKRNSVYQLDTSI
jgi:hypothetical protein